MPVDIDAVKNLSLFETLKESDLLEFCHVATSQQLDANQTIYRMGDDVRSICVILRGRVRLSIPGKYGNPITLAHLTCGEIFGEMPYAQADVCSTNAVTLTETCLLTLNRDHLTYLFTRCPDVALKTIGALEQRLQRTYHILASF